MTDPDKEALIARIEDLEEALLQIVNWSKAYPLEVFPEPSKEYFAKAHEVLTANGMTLDRLSAAAMRRVVVGVGKIARDALEVPHDFRRTPPKYPERTTKKP